MEGGNRSFVRPNVLCSLISALFFPLFGTLVPSHWDNDLIGGLVLSPVCQLSEVRCMLTLIKTMLTWRISTKDKNTFPHLVILFGVCRLSTFLL